MTEAATLTLTDFLLARIAEDEAVAEACDDKVWKFRDHPSSSAIVGGQIATVVYDEGSPTEEQALHIARHDPARVLAECAAKRRVIDAAWIDQEQIEGEWGKGKSREEMGRANDNPASVVALASVYADHPEYRQEWKP